MKQKLLYKSIITSICLAIIASQSITPSAFASSFNTTTLTYPYYAFVEDPEHPWSSVWDALDATDTIEYSDEFFDDPSPGDHPELRALSYALALAGYENQADGYPYDDDLPAYSKLKNLLDQMGFSDYQSWDASSENEGHSMGTTIGHKSLASGQELIVVAPRNYNYMTEWLSNFNVGSDGDHAGFTESASFVIEHLNEYLSTRDFSNYKLWMVGYSRGGAVIDLAAKAINKNIANYSLSANDFYTYTFGAPRASLEETGYTNVHDVKDGNDLLLGYLFPEAWGFYNTGAYEEIHPADLTITASIIDISDLIDSTAAMNVLASNNSLTQDVGTINGKDFMDNWLQFVIENGLTREYFRENIEPPLSKLMQAYQLRTIDKQSDFTDFIKDTNRGLPGMIAGNAFIDLMSGGYESLDDFPPYQDLIKILKGTADDADVDDLLTHLVDYAGEYSDYAERFGEEPKVTEAEFNIIKTNAPLLIKAISPLIIADARYTQDTFGEKYSLYFGYTLVNSAESLVIGHIPESIMPILKSLIPIDPPDDPTDPDDPEIPIPDTGRVTEEKVYSRNAFPIEQVLVMASLFGLAIIAKYAIKKMMGLN